MEVLNLERSGFKLLKLCEEFGHLNENCHFAKEKPFMAVIQLITKIGPFLNSDVNINKNSLQLNLMDMFKQPSVMQHIDKFILDYSSSDSKKNATKSVNYRTRGNQKYASGQLSEASYLYTLAIMFAPNVVENEKSAKSSAVSTELSLAFGNRSAVFFALEWSQACLTDIEHALATGYPLDKRPKLLLRKVECLLKLNLLAEAKQTWRQLESKDGDERIVSIGLQLVDTDDSDCVQQLPPNENDQLGCLPVIDLLTRTGRYKPSATDPCLSVKIEAKTSTTKGRYMMAKQDIEPGDIVTVESPFVTMLHKQYELHFCHHCCRKLEVSLSGTDDLENDLLCINGSTLPCTECTRVLYCSSTCRTESWSSYHRYECGQVLSVLHELFSVCNLSLRILFSSGLDVVSHVIANNSDFKQQAEALLLKNTEPVQDTDQEAISRYQQFFAFAETVNLKSQNELLMYLVLTSILMQLAKKSGFIRTPEEEVICRYVLERHQYRVNINFQQIGLFLSNGLTGLAQHSKHVKTFSVIYLSSSFIRHSCDLNIINTSVRGSLFIQRAVKRIARGEEVTNTLFCCDSQELTERREHALKGHKFDCECSRCVLELRDGIDGKYFPIACKKCSVVLTRETSTSTTYRCSCSSQMSLKEMQRLYSRIDSQLTNAYRVVNSNGDSPMPTGQLATFALELTELMTIPGMKIFWKMADLYKWISFQYSYANMLEKVVPFLELFYEISERFSGKDSKECCGNIITLSDLYLRLGDKEKASDCLKKAISMLNVMALIDIQGQNPPLLRALGGGLLDEDSIYLWNKAKTLKAMLGQI